MIFYAIWNLFTDLLTLIRIEKVSYSTSDDQDKALTSLLDRNPSFFAIKFITKTRIPNPLPFSLLCSSPTQLPFKARSNFPWA